MLKWNIANSIEIRFCLSWSLFPFRVWMKCISNVFIYMNRIVWWSNSTCRQLATTRLVTVALEAFFFLSIINMNGFRFWIASLEYSDFVEWIKKNTFAMPERLGERKNNENSLWKPLSPLFKCAPKACWTSEYFFPPIDYVDKRAQ